VSKVVTVLWATRRLAIEKVAVVLVVVDGGVDLVATAPITAASVARPLKVGIRGSRSTADTNETTTNFMGWPPGGAAAPGRLGSVVRHR
jgi:hypothetical protein